MSLGPILRIAPAVIQTVNDITPIPGLNLASSFAKAIADECEKVVVQKDKCKQLASRASALHSELENARDRAQDPRMKECLDQVAGTLETIYSRTQQWAQTTRLEGWWKGDKIGKEISRSDKEIEDTFKSFNMHVHANLANDMQDVKRGQSDIRQEIERFAVSSQESPQDASQLRGIVLNILSQVKEVKDVMDILVHGNNNPGVLELFLQEGQLGLRDEREQSGVRIGSSLGTSRFSIPEGEHYRKAQANLAQLFEKSGTLPPVKELNGEVVRFGELAHSGGTYSDIWAGMWLGQHKVAIKSLRGVEATMTKAKKCFERELDVWSKLKHPNILPMFGIVTDIGHFFNMISPWQENGNIRNFLAKTPTANRHALLTQASEGIAYLHGQGVIHGNIRGNNILVSAKGTAVICDFGMSELLGEVKETAASTLLTASVSVRWLAPELFDEGGSLSQASDVYSFGMTILECVTLKDPFAETKSQRVVARLFRHEIPDRPTTPEVVSWLPDDLWKLLELCWSPEPSKRPTMSYVSNKLRALSRES